MCYAQIYFTLFTQILSKFLTYPASLPIRCFYLMRCAELDFIQAAFSTASTTQKRLSRPSVIRHINQRRLRHLRIGRCGRRCGNEEA